MLVKKNNVRSSEGQRALGKKELWLWLWLRCCPADAVEKLPLGLSRRFFFEFSYLVMINILYQKNDMLIGNHFRFASSFLIGYIF